jgi:hypothetical protein
MTVVSPVRSSAIRRYRQDETATSSIAPATSSENRRFHFLGGLAA